MKVREILRENFDKVSRSKDGVWTVKRSFFYRLGNSEDRQAAKVLSLFPTAKIVEKFEDWKAWPRESFFVVKFVLPEEAA